MLSRTWLVVILFILCGVLFAQVDSLSIKADSLSVTHATLSKADIEAWLDAHRGNPTAAVFSSIPLQSDFGDIYHAGYMFIGRSGVSMPYRHGFEQLATAFSGSLYQGMYSSFYAPIDATGSINYGVLNYPYPATLSSIHGGIGDFEHRFARVNFRKGDLLGFPGAGYQGDLLVQNGSWTDIIAAETSMKHYLSAKRGLFTVEAEYASWAKDIAMNDLLPVYWQTTNFKLTHDMKQVYAALIHPLAEIKILNSKEQASYYSFAKGLESKTTQLSIAHRRNVGIWRYCAAYEHAWQNSNYRATGSFDQESYKDKLSFAWDSYVKAGFSFKADYLDWDRGRIFTDISSPVWDSFIGVYGKAILGADNYSLRAEDIFVSGGELDLLDQSTTHEAAAYMRYEWKGVSTLLAVGSKGIKQRAITTYLNKKDEQLFVRLAMDVSSQWRNWELQAKPYWVWTNAENNMCESPEFRFQSTQNLFYHLPYNNSLIAGFGVSGHSGYYSADALNPILLEASTALDIWGGFNIDRYFELRVGLQNALSSTIYGAYPAPLSLHVDLRWFYLN
ncbi:MAG: hypothetical protein PHY48_05125 [Candidatus Cloacimonetes bacterium]|nr:hypothetical protein [Candidatus Cloacimonadota bacterium]